MTHCTYGKPNETELPAINPLLNGTPFRYYNTSKGGRNTTAPSGLVSWAAKRESLSALDSAIPCGSGQHPTTSRVARGTWRVRTRVHCTRVWSPANGACSGHGVVPARCLHGDLTTPLLDQITAAPPRCRPAANRCGTYRQCCPHGLPGGLRCDRLLLASRLGPRRVAWCRPPP